MNFLDVKTDFAFKKVFGSEESKDILIDFLNSVIPFENKRLIKSLVIVDPYNIPMLKGMKDTFVDVKAQLDNGSEVIIEMQVLNHEGFEKRVLYNAAKKYSAQLKKGDDFHRLNPVIALTITDFNLFPDQDDVISQFKLLEKKKFIEYSDDIELIFIELPKFDKTEAELNSIQDKWIYFIKNAGQLDCVPSNVSKEQIHAFEIANEANFTEQELDLQHRKKDWIYIQKNSVEYALKTGLEQGIEKGIEQGVEQGKVDEKKEIALNMLNLGLGVDVISQATGLSPELIKLL